MQGICENIRTAIEHGRTDIIRSLLDACTYAAKDLERFDFSPRASNLARTYVVSGEGGRWNLVFRFVYIVDLRLPQVRTVMQRRASRETRY